MQEELKTGEQPIENQALIADANKSELNEFKNEKENALDAENGSLGKFKNTESLLNAYNNLQAEFTRKCQKLKELEKTNEANRSGYESVDETFSKADCLPEAECLNVEKQLKNFENAGRVEQIGQAGQPEKGETVEQQEAGQVEQVGQTVSQDVITENAGKNEQTKYYETKAESPKFEKSAIGQTENASKENSDKKNQFQNEFLKDNEFIKNFIFSHSDIKEEILKSYLEEVQKTKSPKVILSSVGCGIPLATPPKASNLEEAKEIIKKMFD